MINLKYCGGDMLTLENSVHKNNKWREIRLVTD